MRIGHGYDVHKFSKGRKLILCGVSIPYKYGLLGHSDADVATHALMDSILGALSLKDIGYYFPPNDLNYKSIDSLILLNKVYNMAQNMGYTISNLDITIIAQSPKLLNYIDNMKDKLNSVLNIGVDNIGIKATTEEGLGFTGKKKAISAHSVVLLKPL